MNKLKIKYFNTNVYNIVNTHFMLLQYQQGGTHTVSLMDFLEKYM